MSETVIQKTYTTRAGRELTFAFPAAFEVCSRCGGKGTHVNPNIDGHGISPDEFADDPDFAEAYFSGRYDVRCYQCDGLRVMPAVNPKSLSKRLKRAWLLIRQAEIDHANEIASEREYGY